jgi:iron complex outermembrane receptor protein
MATICSQAGLHRTLAKMTLIVALCASCPPPALALMAQQPITFDIPSGPLGNALIEIGKRCGTMVSFNPSLVEGKAAAPVQGEFTPMQAFMQALRASGLSIDVTPNGTVTVQPPPPAAMPAATAAAAAMAPSNPSAHEPLFTEDPPRFTLDPVLVVASAGGSHAEGLKASTASTATRTDTPLSETPQAVSVVTRDALDLQSPNATTTDALRYVTGVTEEGQRMAPALKVRGLPAQYLLSGMESLRRELSIDSAFVERIEVLKGPSGVIGGIAEYGGRGGVVNLVRKSIETQPYVELTQSFTSRDSGTLRTDVDAAGQLASGTYWRAVAFGSRSRRTDSGHDPQHAGGLLGVLGYRDTGFKATLTLQTDHHRIAPRPVSRGGTLRRDGSYTPVDPHPQGEVDATDGLHWRSTDIELDLSWQLSPQWRMAWKGRHERLNSDAREHRFERGYSIDGDMAGVALLRSQTNAQSAGMQWGLIGDVDTGPMKHKLLVSLDLDRARSQLGRGTSVWEVDPISYRPADPLPATPDLAAYQTQTTRERKRSVLMQDQVRLGNWIARLAAQRSRSYEPQNPDGLPEPAIVNWDGGLLYQITPAASVYAGTQYTVESYVESANFLPGYTPSPPLRKLRQTQAGTKLELLERRLSLTLEAFRLRQVSAKQSPSQLPDGVDLDSLPGRSVDGAEAELSGRVSRALDLQLGVNLIRARDVGPYSPTLQNVEMPVTGVPKRALHLLARYRLPSAEPVRNSVGLGFRAYSSSWAATPGSVAEASGLRVPGGALFNVSVTRATQRWSLRASVENLFDRQLYATKSTLGGCVPLQPRRSLGISATFMH